MAAAAGGFTVLSSKKRTMIFVMSLPSWIRSRSVSGRKGGFCCSTYSDYKELFRRDDINLVVSACYSNEHYAVALDLLNHGHNVLNEKLLCKTPQLAQGLIDAA